MLAQFVVTAEIVPPLSTDPATLIDKAMPLKGVVDAVNVTDGAAARSHMSSVVVAGLLAREDTEPVLQFTCRDRNRIALQSDVLGASALGVRNILVLGGDDPRAGDQPDAKAVFDLDTMSLLSMMRQMSEDGTIPDGRRIGSPPKLLLGAADSPIDPPPDWQPDRLAEKVTAGARFVQTQFCDDIDVIRRYVDRLGEAALLAQLSILLGTGPVASARSAKWMRENLWGVIIPDAMIERLANADDEKTEGQKICIEFIEQVREIEGVAGVHVIGIRQDEAIPNILAAAGAGPAYRIISSP
ncbi:MAG: methylenetetrahydrofolate reductase (NADPH) [Gammaproteobacteria bacterium]